VEPLETRELLTTFQNFSPVTSGTPFAPQQFGLAPGPMVVPLTATQSIMQLTSGTALASNQNNQISFSQSDAGTFNVVDSVFTFRIIPGTGSLGGRGDGLSFALLNTANYGSSGAASQSPAPPLALFNGSLGVGFDTFQGTGAPSDNFVVVSFNTTPVQVFPIPTTGPGSLDLASGTFITADVTANFVTSTVTITLTPSGGSALTVVNNLPVAGMAPYSSRLNFTGTAVDSLATMDLQSVTAQFEGLRQPGSISFSSTNYAVAENDPAGLATIDVVRTGGTAGTVTINYVTADGTAKNGVNYISVTGSLTFAESVSQQSFTIPIFDDHVFSSNKTVLLFLSNPTLQATLATPIAATLTIVNTNAPPPTVSPKVTRINLPNTRRVSAFRLTFSQAMDRTSAQNLANYLITMPPAHKGGKARTVALSQAVLDPSGLFVTLYRANLSEHLTKLIQIIVRGKPTTGLISTSGTFLAGSGGVSGTDAILRVSI
jgi:hypothetical protein